MTVFFLLMGERIYADEGKKLGLVSEVMPLEKQNLSLVCIAE